MNSPKYSNIAMLLQGQSAARPNATAIMSDAGDWCYRELFEQAQVLAGWLQLRVSAPGTRVAYLGKEIPEYYLLLYACALAGKVLVPVNFKLAPPEVDYILSDSCAELLFVSAGAEAYVANGNGQTSTAVGSKTAGLEPHNVIAVGRVPESLQALSHLSDLLENKACVVEPALVDENTILVQLYTSGTTGYPKGVELAHSSFIAVGDSLRAHKLDWLDWHPDDVSLVGIPGFHVGGIWWAVQGFNAGSCNLIVESFVASDILARIRTHGITLACMVPSMIQMLLLEPTILQADLTSLRKIVYGGSPIASSVLADALVVLGCEFAQIYGLTETGNTAVCLPPGDHLPGSEKLKAAGKPYPGVEIKINDAEGRRLADEVVGEVCIRTPARMRGYWRNTEATKKTLLGEWVHTGDAGYLKDGYLYICDRIKDMIIVGGENIYPNEIERLLHAHPGVKDVAVIGIPDARWGEKVCAIVSVHEEMPRPKASELRLFLRAHVADFKIPQQVEFIDVIPRNPSGKILRRTLRESYWAGRERAVN